MDIPVELNSLSLENYDETLSAIKTVLGNCNGLLDLYKKKTLQIKFQIKIIKEIFEHLENISGENEIIKKYLKKLDNKELTQLGENRIIGSVQIKKLLETELLSKETQYSKIIEKINTITTIQMEIMELEYDYEMNSNTKYNQGIYSVKTSNLDKILKVIDSDKIAQF